MRQGFFSRYTGILITSNIIIFVIAYLLLIIFGEGIISYLAIRPSSIFVGEKLWTIFTSFFLHVSVWHIFANMASLFFVGMFVEKLIGKKRFLMFYLLSGIFASLFYVSLSFLFGNSVIGARIFGNPNGFALGASGAIFGLLGLLAVLTPKSRVSLIAGPLIAIIAQAIISAFFPSLSFFIFIDIAITIYFLFSIFAMFSFNPSMRKFIIPVEMPFWILPIVAIVPLMIIGFFVSLPIGNMAHLGGIIAGIIYGFYLKHKYPKRTQIISSYFGG